MSRVLVIGGWPPSLVNFRGPLLETLRGRGHEVIGCAGGEDADVAACLDSMGVRYIPLPLERAGLNPLRDLGLLWHLLRLMWRERPDRLLAYTAKPVIYGLLAARIAWVSGRYAMITGLGYAFMNGNSPKQRLVGWLVSRLYRIALHRVAGVFFQNEDDMALFRQSGILERDTRSRRIMGSGVDLGHFAAAPLPEGPTVFLLIARLLADKGIREYIAAARQVKQGHPTVRFALLGPFDPNPAAIHRTELDAWVCEGVVEYWGETADVRPYLARSTVYVLPSYREGMPRSVLEAMSMGRPIITTDVPGCRDTVEEESNGHLVPARDSVSLAKAMLRCLGPAAPLAEMGRASRRLVEARFGVDSVNKVILEAMGL